MNDRGIITTSGRPLVRGQHLTLQLPAPAPTPPLLLRNMYGPTEPAVYGATAATLTVLLYPPVAHALVIEAEATGVPVDPCRRLLPGWRTAIYGTAEEVDALRCRAAAQHARITGDFPQEVDRARYGIAYRADDPEHMLAMYVIFLHCLLSAQEALYQALSPAERDQYCQEAAATVARTFGIQDEAPTCAAELAARYEWTVAYRLQPTSFGLAAAAAMVGAEIGGEPARKVIAQARTFLDPSVETRLGRTVLAGQPGT